MPNTSAPATLLDAAYAGNTAAVRALLEAGAAADTASDFGNTPLLLAALNGHTDIARLLLERARVNVGHMNAFGETPLCAAAGGGHAKIVKMLLEAGADPDGKDCDGATPVLHAAFHGQAGVIALLAGAGANLNARDKDGDTPLIWTARKNHVAALRALLAGGADPERESFPFGPWRDTAWDCALRGGFREAAGILRDARHGKRENPPPALPRFAWKAWEPQP